MSMEKEIVEHLHAWLGGEWRFLNNRDEKEFFTPIYEGFLSKEQEKKYDFVIIPKAYIFNGEPLKGEKAYIFSGEPVKGMIAVYVRDKQELCPRCGSDKVITGTRSDCNNPIKFCDNCHMMI